MNIEKWIFILKKEGLIGELTKLNIDPIRFDENTIGKITLSGTKELLDFGKRIVGDATYSVKNAKICFKSGNDIPDVEIFSNGKIGFSKPVNFDIFEKFLNTYCIAVFDNQLSA